MSNTNTTNSAIITPVLGAGSTDSPYYWEINITQRLCRKTCADRTPIFQPSFSLVGWGAVGTGQYMATISVQGVISYVPCDGNECCMQTQMVAQTFSLPFASGTAPTSVSISSGSTVNAVVVAPCRNCGRTFVSETPLQLSVA